MANFTAFDPRTQNAETLALALLADASVSLVAGSARVSYGTGYDPRSGVATSIAFYDGGIAGLGIGEGLHLSSGNAGLPAGSAAGGDVSVVLDSAAATSDVRSAAQARLGFAPSLHDATVLEFSFTVSNAALRAISFDLVFATNEQPSWDERGFSDFAAVMVNGTNVGVFDGRNDLPLSALTGLQPTIAQPAFRDNDDAGLPARPVDVDYDLLSRTVHVTAPVQTGTNTVKIVIADTGDALGDSGLLVANLRAVAGPGAAPVGSGIGTLGATAGAPGGTPTTSGTEADDTLIGSDKVQAEVLQGLGGDDTVAGGPGNDTLYGGAGADTLDHPAGGAGVGPVGSAAQAASAGLDLLIGGPGDDVYLVQPGDRVVEAAGEGVDWVLSGGRYSLAETPNVENVYLLGPWTSPAASPLGATGSDQANYLVGSEAANYLVGRGGDDALDGRGGADVLLGGAGVDSLGGGDGDDLLIGGAGDDTIEGGAGIDTAVYAGPIADYRLERTGVNWKVTDLAASLPAGAAANEGADWLFWSVERAVFGDTTYELVNPPLQGLPGKGGSREFLFDSVYYLFDNPDLVPTLAFGAAAQHYASVGAAQGRSPNAWFDPGYYENRWPDLTPLQLDDATLFAHFNLYGVWEGRAAGPKFDRFDGNRYLADNPDVAAFVDANLSLFLGSRSNGAIAHFVIYGAAEQRLAYDLSSQPIDLGYVVELAGIAGNDLGLGGGGGGSVVQVSL